MNKSLIVISFFLALELSAQDIGLDKIPPEPDYTILKYWIAHPKKEDCADLVPGRKQLTDGQYEADVDVFFVYPTIYSKEQKPTNPWFADVNDQELNEEIAESTIKNQASVFNGTAKVYAPLYRQGHIKIFYTDTTLKKAVLDFAYQDVKKAFEYYLENWNGGRPIIIASHSQGTLHAVRLLHEYFEEKPLMDKLVAAYIVGMPVQKDEFEFIPVCETPDQTGCWMTWNTFKEGYYPPKHESWYSNALSVNPLTWTTDTTWADWKLNKGGVLRNFKRIKKGVSDAQNHQGLLWIHKPKFFGNFLINWKRYHIVDYNLFYMNIRENVDLRVRTFLSNQESAE